MYGIPEQFTTIGKAQLDAVLGFASITSASAERFADFQMKTAKAMFTDASNQLQTLGTLQSPQEVLQFGSGLAQPAAEKFTGYIKHLYTMAAETQGEVQQFLDTHLAEFNRQLTTFLDQAAKSSPGGGDVAVAAAKSAIAAANQAYDAFTKAGKQVAEVTEAALQAVATAGVQAANTGGASRKKAA